MKLINRLFQFIILPLLIAGAFFTWSLPRITSDYNFNADELIYLSRSSYWTAFKAGDYKNPIWSEWGSYDQPQLTNYLYAAVPGDRNLLAASNSPCPPSNQSGFYNAWSCLDGPPINTWPDALTPTKVMVVKARLLGTAISSIAVASTYFLGLILAGPITGVLAAIYLGWFSFFKNLSTMAMMDQILLIFLNIQLIAAVIIARSKKSNIIQVLSLAIATGLAFSTKLSAILPTTVIYGYLFIQSLRHKRVKLSHLLFSISISCMLFIGLHPPLWSNPITGFNKMLTWRTAQIAAQTSTDYVPLSLSDKVIYSINETLSSWKSSSEISTTVLLSAIAIISMLSMMINNKAFTLMSVVNMALFIVILPLKWNRYLLPIMPTLAVYIGNFPNVLYLIYKKVRDNLVIIRQFLTGALVALVFIALFAFSPITNWLGVIVLLITILLIAQGYLVTRAMLYGFGHRKSTTIPHQPQTNTFTLIVPARDESSVIGHTIHSLSKLNYSTDLYEVLVIIRADDYNTILAAQEAIIESKSNNIRIIQIDGEAHNKAYSLNIGLHLAKNNIIGIFDAEDEPHKNILQKINDYLCAYPETGAVQAPVHLTNLNSSWYASLNAIEYYYWFRSVLPYLATKKIVPLGGNTIFTKKEVYSTIGNYDETCLTEDADMGIKLAEQNITIGVIDDATIATTEETPETEIDVIRQRSRWDQGYFQVIDKSNWRNLGKAQQFYALYTLSQPLFRHLSFLNMIFAPLLASLGHVPLGIVLLSFMPGYFLLLQLGLYMLGLAELAKLHNIKVSPLRYIYTLLAFVPYQALLTLATFRAFGKIAFGNNSWDKTSHANSHRQSLAILEG